jgi:IclR family KDG regulon transcriptional repressor
MKNQRYSINSVIRALKILDSYSFQKSAYTNNELSKKLGLNKSTITALLSSLEEGGFLEKDERTREYRLTSKLFQLGRIYVGQVDLRKVAIPLLTELAVSCHETVHIGFLNKFTVVNIETIESNNPVGIRITNDVPTDANGSGMGKALLAFLDEEELEEYFAKVELRRHTPNTITSKEELKKHLARVKENGYAIDDVELLDDVRCVGAPIFDGTGKAIAAISISGPTYRMTREKIDKEYVAAIKETAAKISRKLGYQDPKGL